MIIILSQRANQGNKLLRYTVVILFLLCIQILVIGEIIAQNEKSIISGKVIDGQTTEPLAFANITFFNSDLGTFSDDKGNFSIENLHQVDSLLISYVGYKSLVIKLDSNYYETHHNFALLPISIFLQEVTVYSHSYNGINTSDFESFSIESEKLKNISVGMPDILRSIQALPGIAVNNEFKADFNVRGGNQDENLVLVNSAAVYEPFHIKEASNASVGIFNMDLIQKVDMITGGFSAKYGDRMSSVLNIKYREGSKTNFKGTASLSLAYLDGYIEGPITDKASFILGIRKSYLEYLLSLIDYKDISSAKPSFYDLQGVLAYHFSSSHKILFEFIHAGDDFSYEPSQQNLLSPYIGTFQNQSAEFLSSKSETENYKASYYSNLFDVQSINLLSSRTLLRTALSYYMQTDNEYRLFLRDENQKISILQDDTEYYDNINTERLTYDTLNIETFELKSEIMHQFYNSYELNAGVSLQHIFYNQAADDIYKYTRKNNLANPNLEDVYTLILTGEYGKVQPIKVHSYKYNAYLENILHLNNNLTVNIGGRADYFDLNKDFTLSPRINIGYVLSNNTKLRAAWGYFYQSPIYHQLKTSEQSDTNTQSQLAVHYIAGLEHSIRLSREEGSYLNLKIEAYYKDYHNLISSYFGTFERLTYSRYNDAVGSAKGLDIYTILNVPGFYCWLSYGLLFTNEDKITDMIGEYPRYTDQRHTLSFVSNFDLGASWYFTLRAYYGSGFPYTPKTAVNNNGNWEWKSKETHSDYLPAYKRIDIRLGKDFNFFNSILNVFVDVSNVFNFNNIQSFEYKAPGFTKPSAEEVLLWPILPSFGIRYKF